MIVTSKIAGYKGNSIFLPAAKILSTGISYGYTFGLYWSSSLHQDSTEYALSVSIAPNDVTTYGKSARYYGLSVRAVSE